MQPCSSQDAALMIPLQTLRTDWSKLLCPQRFQQPGLNIFLLFQYGAKSSDVILLTIFLHSSPPRVNNLPLQLLLLRIILMHTAQRLITCFVIKLTLVLAAAADIPLVCTLDCTS